MYILDAQRQAAFLATLAFVASRDDGWTKHLVSPDGVEWLLYYPNGESHGGGTRVLRVREVPAQRGFVVAWRATVEPKCRVP